MGKLDALIITAIQDNAIYQGLTKKAAVGHPVWVGMLANHLRKNNYSIELIEACVEGYSAQEVAKIVVDSDARLIIIPAYGHQPSASTQTMYAIGKMCEAIKQLSPNAKIASFGTHISALPEKTVEEEGIDFACTGEGILTISNLLKTNLISVEQLKKVRGLCFIDEDGHIMKTPAEKNISQADMDEQLPGMAYDLLPMDKYRAHNWHTFGDKKNENKFATLYTSLGCVYNCKFCCINTPFGGACHRYWSPQHVIKQFETLAEKYDVKYIRLADELFAYDDNQYVEWCEELHRRNYDFNITLQMRVDLVTPKRVEILQKAGVRWVCLGIESASTRVLKDVNKAQYVQEDVRRAVNLLKESGMNVFGNLVFGLPEDNFESMNETLDFAMDLNFEMTNLYSAMAYPGSELYKMAIENKLQLPEDWSGYSQHSYDCLPLPTKYLTAGEVLGFRDYAWKKYHTNPNYLSNLNNKFGQVAHDEMIATAKLDLPRKHIGKIPFVL